ncbi:MAG TPA: Ig-like domain-containing protein, partial [Tepidisphaeraceae bacterium]|nr:Ig-like domain-containing protein [Tepidisphaeraceae bacterium]
DRDQHVMPDAFVACDVNLPNFGKVVDARSLNASSVQLYRTTDHQPVPAVVNTSGAGDAIVLKPREPLDLNTKYTFEVTSATTDTGGAGFAPYKITFTTAAHVNFVTLPIGFQKVALPQTDGNMYTCVEVGPDHRLYASTLDGRIIRYTIDPDGTLGPPQTIKTVQQANGGPRLITGIKFDPSATAENLILWVNHGQLPPLHSESDGQGMIRGAAEWTGRLSRLSGPDLSDYQDYLVHLPRGWKDHLNNQMAFGPDVAMYFCQAANTAMGAPDHKWGFRPERLLTAAVLRVDLKAITHPPLDVQTEEGGHYDPYAPGAPVTLYATGIRNSYDILWHSNGWMYCGINGSAAGGNAPGTPKDFSKIHRPDESLHGPYTGPRVPALWNVRETEDDFLFKIEPGGYYGHPNPVRGEYVLDGGNPTNGADTAEITEYPVGTQPDRNWRGYAYSFGKNLSPCGVIEYRSNAFGGALSGKILFVRYSGGDDIIALTPNPSGDITEALTGIAGFTGFVNPVDLIEDIRSGDIYVAEFGAKRLTLLRPLPGTLAASPRVCREEVGAPRSSDVAHKPSSGSTSASAR